jgi:hypothetical protein
MLQKVFVAVALIGAAKGSQILSNPGFESGSLSPWVEGRSFGGTAWTISSTNCHSGSFCATNNGNNELEQTFAPVAVGSITDISFWALHTSASVNALAVDLLYSGGGDDEFIVNTSGTGWNFFDVFADLRSSGSLVGIGMFGNSGGVSFLDDASVTTSAPEPASSIFLLLGLGVLAAARWTGKRLTVR